nr:MAG TPA: hypothetical protein [Caudoviricetes sp.]
MVRTATAENAAGHDDHYRGGSALRFSMCALIGHSDSARDCAESLYFPGP